MFSPGESHGQRSSAGYSPWGRRESDTTERLSLTEYRRGAAHVAGRLCVWTRARLSVRAPALGRSKADSPEMPLAAPAALSRLINLGGKAKTCKRTGESFKERLAQRTLVVVRFQKTDGRVLP